MTVFGRLAALALAVALPALAQGQSTLTSQGSELSLSGERPGDQTWPGLALGADYGYAVWQDNALDTAGTGIGARLLGPDGAPLDAPFRVNAATGGNPAKPGVALLRDGGAVFVWQDGRAGFQSVYARFLNERGSFLSTDLLVSQPLFSARTRSVVSWPTIRNNRLVTRRFLIFRTINHRREFNTGAAAAGLSDGNAVVAYASYTRLTTNEPALSPEIRFFGSTAVTNSLVVGSSRAEDNMQDIYVRRYTPGGLALGAEFRANQTIKFNQRDPAITALDGGAFVVVWVTEQRLTVPPALRGATLDNLVNTPEIYGRVFDAAGNALSAEFAVNTSDAACASPSVAKTADGGFRVVWAQQAAEPSGGWDVYSRRFDRLSAAAGAAVRVNVETIGDQVGPRIASAPAGEVVVWTTRLDSARLVRLQTRGRLPEGDPNALTPAERAEMREQLRLFGQGEDVHARWMSGDSFGGGQFLVNATTLGRQFQPTCAAASNNRVFIGWSGLTLTSGFEVFGQLYSASQP